MSTQVARFASGHHRIMLASIAAGCFAILAIFARQLSGDITIVSGWPVNLVGITSCLLAL